MANPAMKNQLSPRQLYEQKYRVSRMNLLLVLVFTAINLILLVTNADSYFLFSAFLPYYFAGIGMLLCGRFPPEFYEGAEDIVFLDTSVFAFLLAVAILFTLMYLVAFLLSNKGRVGWLIFALVFFGVDTLGMFVLNGISLESILDLAFHAWIIYELSVGIHAHYQLKKLPPEEEVPAFEGAPIEGEAVAAEGVAAQPAGSFALRVADPDVKHRVLAEAQFMNYHICYRRVKHTNELVVNGTVYDEIAGVMEYPHTLKAHLDGHYISASYTGTHSCIAVDGETLVKKVRWF